MKRLLRRLAAHTTQAEHRNGLRAVGLSDGSIEYLAHEGIDPLAEDYELVSMAAAMGTRLHDIPLHVTAAKMLRHTRLDPAVAMAAIGRLNSWGIPHKHAATIIADIARAAREDA